MDDKVRLYTRHMDFDTASKHTECIKTMGKRIQLYLERGWKIEGTFTVRDYVYIIFSHLQDFEENHSLQEGVDK